MPRRPLQLNGLEDMAMLLGAMTPQELWQVLVRYRGMPDAYPGHAISTFKGLHGDGTPGALTTARLLCTDRRWEPCTHRLVRGIVETSILSDEELDELAHDFVWPVTYTFRYPIGWIGTDWVTVTIDDHGASVEGEVEHVDPARSVATDRYIAPPLRRWGADWVMRSAPEIFSALRDIALAHGSRDGDAIVSGVVDAVGATHPEFAPAAVELGLGWPRGSVRLLALELLARTDPEAARRHAATDPDKKVRKWAPDRVDDRSSKKPAMKQTEFFPE